MTPRLWALLLAAAIGGPFGPAAADGPYAPITFLVTDLRFSGGSVRVDICTEATFLKTNCPYSASAPALAGTTSVTVNDVPPGLYAAQMYHDWNDNDVLDRSPLGIPREGLAFSRDAPLGLAGPRFSRAAFQHGLEPQTLTVRLRHFAPPPKRP